MRIGELAEQAGVSPRSLRYYEEQGLLASTRTPSGQRTYAESDVGRVRFLRQLYAAGLTSRAISVLLRCVDAHSAETSDQAWARMLQEREHLAARIDDLVRARDALDELIAAHRRYRESAAADSAAC